jgi:uncharacterized protein DUF2865
MGRVFRAYRETDVFTGGRSRVVRQVVGALGVALALSALPAPASAQGFFESLFGGFRRSAPPPQASAFADPFGLFGGERRSSGGDYCGGGGTYCVRTCDGRFFPIQRLGGVTPAQACSSFCPASQTKIYNGGTIDTAVGTDGKPYRDLATAFVYREKIVPGCTCNGKDAFGLVNTPVAEDATLRPGDIVATKDGLMAYNGSSGGGRKQAANFTPIQSYPGLSSELRRKLTETKIDPVEPTPPPQVSTKPADPAPTVRGGKRRVQVDR